MAISQSALRQLKNMAAEESSGDISGLYTRLLLCALKILDAGGKLHLLAPGRKGAENRQNINALSARQVFAAIVELHTRLEEFLPIDSKHPVQVELSLNSLDSLDFMLEDLTRPELCCLWSDPTSLGYAYQFFSHRARRGAQNAIQTANKELTAEKLIAFTQLYTPDWVVDFLLANTILDQWKGTREAGTLNRNVWKYWIPSQKAPALSVRELTVLDPACGSGHFLVRAFHLLLDMYEHEGYSRSEAVRSIVTLNLAGADIDLFALRICGLSVYISALLAGDGIDFTMPNLAGSHCEDNLLGSLSPQWSEKPDHPLSKNYLAVVTNPPYIGRKLLSRGLKDAMREEYPESCADLCAAFLQKSLSLLSRGGRVGMITQASWLFLPTYGKMRRRLIEEHAIHLAVEAGTGVFPLQGGEKVNSLLLVCGKDSATTGDASLFIKLSAGMEKAGELEEHVARCRDEKKPNEKSDAVFRHEQRIFSRSDHHTINYSCPEVALALALKGSPLAEAADIRQGLATTDNERFVRHIWDVDPGAIGSVWVPYAKGAGSQRWYSPTSHVVYWENNGQAIKDAVAESYPYLRGKTAWVVKNEQYYFRPGLCFSFVNSKELAVRILEPGCIFDVASSAVFADKCDSDFLLAFLNSSLTQAFAVGINPTINFQVGDVKRIPFFPFASKASAELAELARQCCHHKRKIMAFAAHGLDLGVPEEVEGALKGEEIEKIWARSTAIRSGAVDELKELEALIDRKVFDNVTQFACLDGADRRSLQDWINSQTISRSAAAAGFIAQEEFARALLMRLLHERVKLETSIDLSPGSNDSIAAVLKIPVETILWILRSLNVSPESYFRSGLSKDAARHFKKHPPFIVVSSQDQAHVTVVAGESIRGQRINPARL